MTQQDMSDRQGVGLAIRAFHELDQDDVVSLWHDCDLVKPWNDPVKDIRRKLEVQRELFLVGTSGGKLVATVMAGFDGHRGWINHLAVACDYRRRGYGRLLMGEATRRLKAIGCPKINLQIRRSNLGVVSFYESLGYIEDDAISMGRRLVQD